MDTKRKFIATSKLMALSVAIALPAYADHHEEPMEDKAQVGATVTQPADRHMDRTGADGAIDRSDDDMETAVRTAWMEGKLETVFLLNRHLNNFTIDSEVMGDKAVLTGKVESDIDKDLAEQVALGVEGINSVDNQLQVVPGDDNDAEMDDDEAGERTFAQTMEDATLTAEVKMALLADDNTDGLDINVDTMRQQVKLRGKVDSAEQKDLAEKLASNIDGVENVDNQLTVGK